MRQGAVPSAYRAFYRQVGLDPDIQRSPLDEAIYQRLLQGSFKSWGHLEDAVTVAGLETLVPIWAMDAGGTDGGIGLRSAQEGEALIDGDGVGELAPGQLIIADSQGPLAALLAEPPKARKVTKYTDEAIIYTVQPEGVPGVTVQEALLVCEQMMAER
jgi:DNA/RNA-binding domain of Phe-tRNA-synthetase-like protein